jgi:hypothetical protein
VSRRGYVVLGGPFVLLLALSLAGLLHADVMLGYGVGLIAVSRAANLAAGGRA